MPSLRQRGEQTLCVDAGCRCERAPDYSKEQRSTLRHGSPRGTAVSAAAPH